jgi:hypothetical protein
MFIARDSRAGEWSGYGLAKYRLVCIIFETRDSGGAAEQDFKGIVPSVSSNTSTSLTWPFVEPVNNLLPSNPLKVLPKTPTTAIIKAAKRKSMEETPWPLRAARGAGGSCC